MESNCQNLYFNRKVWMTLNEKESSEYVILTMKIETWDHIDYICLSILRRKCVLLKEIQNLI
jgi:hypothetical protein